MKIKYFAWVAEIIDKREEEIKVPDHVTDVNTLINFLCTEDESYEAAFANRKQIDSGLLSRMSASTATGPATRFIRFRLKVAALAEFEPSMACLLSSSGLF